ncbi:LysR substrate-binding domain-containing protein [Novosphingobium sp. 1949]|uniref:LysR substrate-binding domain-containing protein n=1 Tax=Novosphingobium organovorum TaxID=2930092 RepID=A0ABT0BDP3_9SPHN|nr:LysR family transcriptional regulator [Novosphingobium organovorum]MCJ2183187.1 LysR substrate-binding domain-containing protein [Novosphingobium organovorum]
MDRLTSFELFVRIVDRGSFSAAAASLGISRPVATATIQTLEKRLGARLLHRTTRHVRPSAEGEAFYQRCRAILADVEDAERNVGGTVAGIVRIDIAGRLARATLLPALPAFLARHPQLTVYLGEGERFVDLVREGVDCVVRAGALSDSDMIARPLGTMEEVTCASPAYLAAHGTPTTPEDLLDERAGHQAIGFVSSRTGQVLPLEFRQEGRTREVLLPARLLVNGADSYAAAARLGLGLLQAPRHGLAGDLASGALIEVLADYRPVPTPLSLLYPSQRQVPARVRLVMDWIAATLASTT